MVSIFQLVSNGVQHIDSVVINPIPQLRRRNTTLCECGKVDVVSRKTGKAMVHTTRRVVWPWVTSSTIGELAWRDSPPG